MSVPFNQQRLQRDFVATIKTEQASGKAVSGADLLCAVEQRMGPLPEALRELFSAFSIPAVGRPGRPASNWLAKISVSQVSRNARTSRTVPNPQSPELWREKAIRRRMGGPFRSEVRSSNQKSLLILGLITNILAQRIDGFGEAGGGRGTGIQPSPRISEPSPQRVICLQRSVPFAQETCVLLKTSSCFPASLSLHFLLQAIAGDIGLVTNCPRSIPCLPPSSLQVAAGAALLKQGPPSIMIIVLHWHVDGC
jgi:hypothetical protein